MKTLVVYARLYAECFTKALGGIRRNLWTLLLPVILLIAFNLAMWLVAPLGIAGGFAAGLILDALLAAYLYFLGEIIASAKVHLRELKKSFGRHFWSVLNLTFVIWIARFVLGSLVGRSPNGGLVMLLL